MTSSDTCQLQFITLWANGSVDKNITRVPSPNREPSATPARSHSSLLQIKSLLQVEFGPATPCRLPFAFERGLTHLHTAQVSPRLIFHTTAAAETPEPTQPPCMPLTLTPRAARAQTLFT